MSGQNDKAVRDLHGPGEHLHGGLHSHGHVHHFTSRDTISTIEFIRSPTSDSSKFTIHRDNEGK